MAWLYLKQNCTNFRIFVVQYPYGIIMALLFLQYAVQISVFVQYSSILQTSKIQYVQIVGALKVPHT